MSKHEPQQEVMFLRRLVFHTEAEFWPLSNMCSVTFEVIIALIKSVWG